MKFEFIPNTAASVDKGDAPSGIAYLVDDTKKFSKLGAAADKSAAGYLAKLAQGVKFTGKAGQVTSGVMPSGPLAHVLLGSAGPAAEAKVTHYENLGGALAAEASRLGLAGLTIIVESAGGVAEAEAAARILYGARLRSYRFDKYFTTRKADEKPTLKAVYVAVADEKAAKKAYKSLDAIASGIELTRDVVSEPANVIYPETLAAVCKDLEQYGLKVEIFGEKEMTELGMGSLLCVGQGSVRESKMVIMRWNGGEKKGAPLAFVGKGVCFDTGGISLKPPKGMEEMKWDMGGAGTVIGLMKALALRGAKVNAVGAVGLVENMPDGAAVRPGDVVKSMSGQTIEVLNTDAEGRLVLADVLWYVQNRFKPQFMIDLATLTGAIIVALGHEYAGLFSNDDELSQRLHAIGNRLDEKVWRFPLSEAYDKQIDSEIADMQNIGADREAGSITAAQFLKRFVNAVPWAHLDIAGTAWNKKDHGIFPKGAAGWGIRLLNELVAEHYEK